MSEEVSTTEVVEESTQTPDQKATEATKMLIDYIEFLRNRAGGEISLNINVTLGSVQFAFVPSAPPEVEEEAPQTLS
jgi:hypothetical protein